jgi:hypothetical protein
MAAQGKDVYFITLRNLTLETRVQFRVASGDIRGGRTGTTESFSPSSSIFFRLVIIPPPPHAVCDSPDKATHYHTVGTKLGASSLTWNIVGFSLEDGRSLSLRNVGIYLQVHIALQPRTITSTKQKRNLSC